MLVGFKKSGTTLFVRKFMRVMKKMKAELHEHRYCLEKNVEQRTALLMKRIAVLECCNATLCDKLVQAQKELVSQRRLSAHALPVIESYPKVDRVEHADKWDELANAI